MWYGKIINNNITIIIPNKYTRLQDYKMNNIDIIKKRLKDIKQLSENLKTSSMRASREEQEDAVGSREREREKQRDRDENVNIIRMIMELTKNTDNNSKNAVKNRQTMQPETQQVWTQKQSILFKDVKNKTKPPKALPTNTTTTITTMQHQIEQLQKDYQQKLSSQNKQLKSLHSQIQSLTEELAVLKSKASAPGPQQQPTSTSQANEEESVLQLEFRHLSYFHMTEVTNLYLTKINIRQEDWGKIQYSVGEIKLGLNYIEVKVQKKWKKDISEVQKQYSIFQPSPDPNLNTNNSTNITGRLSKRILKLDLSDLLQVSYLPTNTLLLKFKQDDQQQRSLYLQFGDYEHLHKWDLGIFVNLTIVKNLSKEKMFTGGSGEGLLLEAGNSSMVESVKWGKRGKSIGGGEDDQLYGKWMELYDSATQKAGLQRQENQIIRRYYLCRQKLQKMETKLRECGLDRRLDLKLSHKVNEQDGNLIKLFPIRVESINVVNNVVEKKQENLGQKSEQIKKLEQLKNIQEQKQRKRAEQQQTRKIQQDCIRKQQQQKRQQLAYSKNILKKGMYMTKYSQSAFNPHYKKVFLSQDEQKLCWKDKDQRDENQYKYIPVSDVVAVQYGATGPGIEKHVPKKDRLDPGCYVVIRLRGDKRKQMEFSMEGMDLMKEFCDNFGLFIQSLRQGKE